MGKDGLFKQAKEFVSGMTTNMDAIQKCPYTCVVEQFELAGWTQKVYVGIGFSKCRWPDTFDESYGESLARLKAEADIARQLIADGWTPDGI